MVVLPEGQECEVDSYLLQPSIKSLGHSGCEIKLIQDGHRIRKKSSHPGYNARLLEQINKQKQFRDDHLSTPEVYDVWEEDQLLVAEMEYINAADFICYVEVKPIRDVLCLIEKLCDFITARIQAYPISRLPKDTIEDKLESVKRNIGGNPLTADMVSLVPDIERFVAMPLGPCHGDLTFSNLLITRDDEIYVIDFLDSFVEGPLIDIVKLRQDTRHYWSIRRCDGDFDHTKIEVVFDRFDRIICDKFESWEWWSNYRFFQKLNLCRILPYVTKPDDAEFLKVEIARV